MRICLINPPLRAPVAWGIPKIFPPLGLAYIAAVLEEKCEVSIIDAPARGYKYLHQSNGKYHLGLEYKEIATDVKRVSPDVIGITVPFTVNVESAFKVASSVKEIDRDIITVLGGPHPSIRPAECLQNPDVDFVVIGEGEHTMLELVQKLEKGKNGLHDVRGLAYVRDGRAVFTPPRPVIQDLDSLPFPARHLLPMNEYFEVTRAKLTIREMSKPWTTMITSRGCPYNCIFCSIHIVMGRKWRPRSAEKVVDEIEQLVHNFHIKQIDFEDDNITLNRKRMATICDLIVQRGLDIEWFTRNGVRADTLDENLLRKMKKSGCKELWVSPESGVQRIVDQIIKKRLTLKKIEEVVVLSKKVGIGIGCYFVIGLIGETKGDIKKTIGFARKLRRLGADHLDFNIATPYYGTELYEQAKQKGYLRAFNEESLGTLKAHIETPEFTLDEIRELQEQAKQACLPPLISYDNFMRAVRYPEEALRYLVKKMARRKTL